MRGRIPGSQELLHPETTEGRQPVPLDCRLRGNDGERMTRESPFRQAEPVEAWFLTLDCRLRGNDGEGSL